MGFSLLDDAAASDRSKSCFVIPKPAAVFIVAVDAASKSRGNFKIRKLAGQKTEGRGTIALKGRRNHGIIKKSDMKFQFYDYFG